MKFSFSIYSFSRTLLIGFGILNGDWLEARKVAKKINLIEPVVEGTLQLFFLSSILYTTQGPDQNPAENRPFDISSILFTEKTSSRILFLITFCSSFLSVGISFARLLAQGSKPVIKKIVSWQLSQSVSSPTLLSPLYV